MAGSGSGVGGSSGAVLRVEDLRVTFGVEGGEVEAVRGVSFEVMPGEVLGIVGESGSGKSVSMASVLGLLPGSARVGGRVWFGGEDLLSLPYARLRRIRGREIAMVFQDPMTSFNPVRTIGHQIAEAIRVHDRVSRAAARDRAVELLELVGVPSPATRFSQFPFEFSGGMRQRAMIAMAMANRPRLLIADEPTTALDVTVQAQILEVLGAVQRETGAATILITHDLGVIAEMADRVLVMYGGRVAESGGVGEIFADPRHPYTLGLLASLPRMDVRLDQLLSIPGQPPSMRTPPSGCAFHARCALRGGREACVVEQPGLVEVGVGHVTACHFSSEMGVLVDGVRSTVGTDVRSGGAR